MKRMFFGLVIAALGAGIVTLVTDGDPEPAARLVAADNPAVAGASPAAARWGHDELRAPARTRSQPTRAALPARVVILANQRALPAPPETTEPPQYGP